MYRIMEFVVGSAVMRKLTASIAIHDAAIRQKSTGLLTIVIHGAMRSLGLR